MNNILDTNKLFLTKHKTKCICVSVTEFYTPRSDKKGSWSTKALRKVFDRRKAEFWATLSVTARGCWVHPGAKVGKGYAQVGFCGFHLLAHRLAYLLTFGSIPKDLDVLHHCDNMRCCNPNHLFLGNDQDNVDDMIAKGRSAHQKGTLPDRHGENNSHAKLTVVKVAKLKRDWVNEKYATFAALGRAYGISGSYTKSILDGKHW